MNHDFDNCSSSRNLLCVFNDEVSFNLYIIQLQKKEVENDMIQKRLNNLVLCFGFNIHFELLGLF